MSNLAVGGLIKIARNESVITGRIRKLTDTYFQIEGLPPIKRDYWAVIWFKPADKVS